MHASERVHRFSPKRMLIRADERSMYVVYLLHQTECTKNDQGKAVYDRRESGGSPARRVPVRVMGGGYPARPCDRRGGAFQAYQIMG